VETAFEGHAFSVEKSMLKDMIRATCFAASIEESRGIITGVLMEFKKDSFNMVALDGYRMAIVREKVRGEEDQNVVISARNMSEIGKLLSEEAEEADIEIRLGEKNAVFILNNTKVVTRVMEGEFIKYNDILPKENRIKVKANRREIMESVDRASIVVREGKNSFIKFTLQENEIVLFSRADEATTKESIKVEKEGDDLEIGFNARFMSDTLKAIDDEFIIMHFNTGINPCLITPQEGDAYEYLILPVRLSTVNV
jgi:DNA polymerase-3 subunit beta